MPCDELPDELKIAWNEVGSFAPVLSADQVRAEARKLEASRRKQYLLGILIAVSGLPGYLFLVFYFHSLLVRIGATLCLLAFGYLLVGAAARRTRGLPDPADTDGIGFYRAELERRRDWHRFIQLRILMLAPPILLVDLGLAREIARLSPLLPPILWLWGLFLLAVFGFWGPAKHRRAARKYQDRIDALNSRNRR